MKHALVAVAAGAAVGVALGAPDHSAAARGAKAHDLPQSYIFTPAGKVTPLKMGITYCASQFPPPITATPPASGWSRAQWKSGVEYFSGGGPPNYGWVHLAGGPADAPPLGLISIMTAYAGTPSIATTVNTLRTRGRGAEYDETSQVTLAGYAGMQVDGRITGAKNVERIGHFLVPFSLSSDAARYYSDEYGVYGDLFRVIVLGVRGHTVVVYIENAPLPPAQFPTFLAAATRVLRSLRFPKGA